MSDIHCFFRVGPPPDDDLRKTLLVVAQIMIENERSELDFDHAKGRFTGSISTDFKPGRVETYQGTIFRAEIQYTAGGKTELLFLVGQYPEWPDYVEMVEIVQPQTFEPGGDPETNKWN